MIPVGKAFRLRTVPFKIVLNKANTKKRKRIVKSYVPLDAGEPELCNIPMHL